jgi:hypothetical protein
MLFIAAAVLTIPGTEKPFLSVATQAIDSSFCPDQHVTTVAAITAIRSTIGNVHLPPESDGAIATVPRFYSYFSFIEHILQTSQVNNFIMKLYNKWNNEFFIISSIINKVKTSR